MKNLVGNDKSTILQEQTCICECCCPVGSHFMLLQCLKFISFLSPQYVWPNYNILEVKFDC